MSTEIDDVIEQIEKRQKTGTERKRSKTERFIIVVTLGLILGLLIVKALEGNLYPNIGVSTSQYMFWKDPGPIHQGDFVAFTLEHPLLEHPVKVVKQVRCDSGQYLEVTNESASCDGEFLGLKKKYTLKGDPMPVFTYDGVIPDGKVFVMNEHEYSFDSRYYGLKDKSIMTRLKVLF